MLSTNLSCLHIGSNASQVYNVYQNQALGWIVIQSVMTHDNLRRCFTFLLPGFHPLIHAEDTDRFRQIFAWEKDQITTPPWPAVLSQYFSLFEMLPNFQHLLKEWFKTSNILEHVDTHLMCKRECSLWRPSQVTGTHLLGIRLRHSLFEVILSQISLSDLLRTSFSAQRLAL